MSNAAAGLKDRVTGIYGGSGETGSAAGTGEGLTKPGVEYEDEASFCRFNLLMILTFTRAVIQGVPCVASAEFRLL